MVLVASTLLLSQGLLSALLRVLQAAELPTEMPAQGSRSCVSRSLLTLGHLK